MNGSALDQRIRMFEAVDYEPDDLDAPIPAFGLVIIVLSVIGWAAFIGVAYCLYQGAEAVFG